MTVEPASSLRPSGQRPRQASTATALHDLASSVLFYGILGLGVLGPICLAIYSELFR